jgi:hypothetical protein
MTMDLDTKDELEKLRRTVERNEYAPKRTSDDIAFGIFTFGLIFLVGLILTAYHIF